MKAWVLTAHGAPERVLQLRERPEPEPGPTQVLIRSEGFGLNYADAMAVRGLYRDAPPLPSVLGYETVGRVIAAGADAPAALIGQRVTAITRFGGYAELAVTDHRACATIPDALPLGEAAALATQGATAWYATRVLCPLRKGERVLVHSAAGGVGQLIVQLAVDTGCEVVGIASGAAKCEQVRGMGAAHAIDRGAGDYEALVRAALQGAPLDASFNAVGGSSFKKDMRLLGTGGRLVLYGGAERGRSSTLAFVWRMGVVLPIFLMMRSRSLLGINMLRLGDDRPAILTECLREAVDAHARGVLRPHVHGSLPATALPQALSELAAGTTSGKLVLRW
ncbi:MAG: zinc-binding dehydrogenase [Flavobacteriales bacterium]|nr:zinc-binding dehydrogenase [Flavobacteriales bacterium]